MNDRGSVDLASFDNAWYHSGRPVSVRLLWMLANRVFLQTSVPWPSGLKCFILRAFGARVGRSVVIKPRVNIKYAWHLSIGDHSWIGEGVWLDSIGSIRIGSNACLSQEVMIETGNHDWSEPKFDLIVKEVVIENGAWAAVRSILLPGSRLASHSVLGAGAVLSGDTEPYCVYAGNPASKIKARWIDTAKGRSAR